MGRVVVLCGMPGSGKTTLARRLERERDAVRIELDAWLLGLGVDPHEPRARRRLERLLWAHALRLASLGLVVVVDFGSWGRVERRRMREQARAAGVAFELHLLDVALEERWRRVERRNADEGAVVISRAELVGFERWWEPPDADELAAYDADPTPGSSVPGSLDVDG